MPSTTRRDYAGSAVSAAYEARVGDLVWNAYWQEYYVVIRVETGNWRDSFWLGNGKFSNSSKEARVTHHCTPFEERRDLLVARNVLDGRWDSYAGLLSYLRMVAEHHYENSR